MLYTQRQVVDKRAGHASLLITIGIFEAHSKGWHSPLVTLGLVTGRVGTNGPLVIFAGRNQRGIRKTNKCTIILSFNVSIRLEPEETRSCRPISGRIQESVVQDLYYDTNFIDAAGRLSNEGTSFELSRSDFESTDCHYLRLGVVQGCQEIFSNSLQLTY